MEVNNFEYQILSCLTNNDKNCIELIQTNKNEIISCLKEESYCKEFIQKLNSVILKKKDDFALIEKVLRHPAFTEAFNKFRESDILIRACQNDIDNEALLKWLITMEVNDCIQDDNGMTALMYAVKKPSLLFVVQYFIYNNNACVNITDNNDESALFHAVYNIEAFKALIGANIKINQINAKKETVLLYCCKNSILNPIRVISYQPELDINIVDSEGRTAPMYLVEKGHYHEFQLLTGGNIDLDYKNEKGETLLSILVNCIYNPKNENDEKYIIPYIKLITILVQMDCNFNISIDEEGNTPLMFFIMIEDIYTVNYIVTFSHNLNVSIKNNKGDTAFSLSLKLNNKSLIEIIMNHPSFDFNYIDQHGNNLLMLYSFLSNINIINKVLKRNPNILNQVNDKNENALIIATKLRNSKVIKIFLNNKINIDQQDHLGNTALYYAVQLNIPVIINDLVYAGANLNLKNNDGISPYDLVNSISSNETLLEIINHPIPYDSPNFLQKSKSKSKIFSLKKITKKYSNRRKSNNNKNSIEYFTVENCHDIIEFSIKNDKNLYEPLKNYESIIKSEMETYGYKDVIPQKTSAPKSVIRQAVTLEVLVYVLDAAGNLF